MPRKAKYFIHQHVEHYCTDCGARCMPSSKFEQETQSPAPGLRKPVVLLRSYNSSPAHRQEKIAWCFSCGGFREQRRLLEDEILRMFLTRKGVGYRNRHNLELLATPVRKGERSA